MARLDPARRTSGAARWVAAVALAASAAPAAELPAALHGAFEADDGALYAFSADTLALRDAAGPLLIGRVLDAEGDRVEVRLMGVRQRLRVSRTSADRLLVEWGSGRSTALQRLDAEPAQLSRAPVPLGAPGPLTPERIAALRAEVDLRLAREQAARRDPARAADVVSIDAENARWLRAVVSEVGWIDARRFGPEAARAALALLRHGLDLPLMRAALPLAEADARAGALAPRAYAALHDRVLLQMGERQRYGTQVGGPAAGGARALLPIEDRARVDARRREIGLPPLANYLAELRARQPAREIIVLEE